MPKITKKRFSNFASTSNIPRKLLKVKISRSKWGYLTWPNEDDQKSWLNMTKNFSPPRQTLIFKKSQIKKKKIIQVWHCHDSVKFIRSSSFGHVKNPLLNCTLCYIVVILTTVSIILTLKKYISIYLDNSNLGWKIEWTFKMSLFLCRFQLFTEFFAASKTFTLVLCILFHFGNAFICSNTVLLCCFRLMCLQNITFVEDHFDEKFLRISVSSFGCAISVTACALLIVNADIKTGTAFSMFTKLAIKDGKLSAKKLSKEKI